MKCTCGAVAVRSHYHSSWCDTNTSTTIWSEILDRAKKTNYITVVTKNNPSDAYSKLKDLSESDRLMTIENTDFYSIVMYNGATIDLITKDNTSYLDRAIVDCMFLEAGDYDSIDQNLSKYSRGDVVCFNPSTGQRTGYLKRN
jgi:hypothetical protein